MTNDTKGLETHTLNVEALGRSWDTELARLQSTLADAKKETKEANAKKERVQQKAFDDVYNAHEASFNHCL